jgi:hypothetical protein
MEQSTVRAPELSRLPATGSRLVSILATAPPAALAAAALSLLAGVIHLVAVPEHLAAWWGYGAFFIAAFAGQSLLAGAVLRRPTQLLASIGIWANLAIVWLYVITRTSGVPVGPPHEGGHSHAGRGAEHVESVGMLDMTATIAELGTVVALAALLGDGARKRTLNAMLAFGAFMWLSRATGVL